MSLATDLLITWMHTKTNADRHRAWWQRIRAQQATLPVSSKDTSPTAFDIKRVGGTADLTAETAARPTLYWWGTAQGRAAQEASTSLPPNAGLHSILYDELPRTGLWVYETPWVHATASETQTVTGLLWRLSSDGLWMTTLEEATAELRRDSPWGTEDYQGLDHVGELVGTWAGWWPNGIALSDLEAATRLLMWEAYPAPEVARLAGTLRSDDSSVSTTLFFAKLWLASVQWLRQRILVTSRVSPLPKNKKRRRKLQAKFGDDLPQIEIVQLRRSASSPTTGTGTGRGYAVQFVVRGFWRNQYYPSRSVHAPKWIDSYLKGPKDAPLKHAMRIYAVTR
jgi:hypothetical protein